MIWAFEDALGRGGRWWFEQALQRGLLLRPMGNTVYLMPPYIMNDEEMVFVAQVIMEVLEL